MLPTPCPCPLCRWGTLTPLVMMETLACDFCGHLFQPQGIGVAQGGQLEVLDLGAPYTWQWQGERWRSLDGQSTQATPWIWLLAVFLTLGPPALVLLAQYCFPPLDPAPGLTFGQGWAIATGLTHGFLGLGIVGSYYQVPLWLAAQGRGWRQRWQRQGFWQPFSL